MFDISAPENFCFCPDALTGGPTDLLNPDGTVSNHKFTFLIQMVPEIILASIIHATSPVV